MVNADERVKIIPKSDRAKVIAGVGLLGGMILLITGLFQTRLYGYTGDALIFYYIHAIVTIAWACFAIASSIILLRGNNKGYIILLIAGIGALIRNFIPIYQYDPYGYGYIITIYLSSSMVYIDIVLMLLGGIYGVALKDKER